MLNQFTLIGTLDRVEKIKKGATEDQYATMVLLVEDDHTENVDAIPVVIPDGFYDSIKGHKVKEGSLLGVIGYIVSSVDDSDEVPTISTKIVANKISFIEEAE